jgi:hypothetical protein
MPTHEEDIRGDLDRSIERIVKAEEQRASVAGFGATLQGQALLREPAYLHPLTQVIHACRIGRKTAVTTALTKAGKKSATIARELLFAGITIGVGKPDELGDAARWIGRLLGYSRGRLALDIGMWGVEMLLSLPIFVLENGIPTLPLTDEIDAFFNEVVANAVQVRPLLLPLNAPPVPWTQVRKGVTPPGHWAQPLLVNNHPSIERIWHKAISDGRMRAVLDALNYLQSVPFTINQPILDLLNREPPEPVPDEPDPYLPRGEMWHAQRERRKVIDQMNALSADRATATYLASQPFYLPQNLDSRGRMYAIPNFNFTREDRIRALFQFAKGAPIGVEGLRWLKARLTALRGVRTKSRAALTLKAGLSGSMQTLSTCGTLARLCWPAPRWRRKTYRRLRATDINSPLRVLSLCGHWIQRRAMIMKPNYR